MFSADQLLLPISDAQPCGTDLSFSSDLDAIAKARRFDDPSIDQGEWVTEIKEADWGFVIKHCTALLTEQSKDLRLAVWLTEASAKVHHLRGMGEGLRVLAGLLEQFWDRGLYPESDGDDHEQRVGNLSWILGRVPALLREMPLTEGSGTAYSAIDFEVARKQAAAAEKEPFGSSSNRPAEGPTLADMEAAKRKNSARFCAAFNADAHYCMDALLALEKVADDRLGRDSPGFAAARDAIDTMLHAMPAPADGGAAPAPFDGAAAAMADNVMSRQAAPAPVPAGPPGAIHSRTQAIAQLRQVAEFFRRTEPHSPVSYFADKAANAGEQDLHTWLRSVVKDSASLSHIEELLGIDPNNN
jgi:type VI secretion system protein ImpA